MSKHNFFSCLCAILFLCVACNTESSQKPVVYPDQQSLGFQQFSHQCSTCHRPPMPDVHIASAWPEVVARMQQHKQQRGLVRMNGTEKQQVLDYLQRYAQQDEK